MKKKLVSLALVFVLVMAVAVPVFAVEVPPELPSAEVQAQAYEHEHLQTPEEQRGRMCVYCFSVATHEIFRPDYIINEDGGRPVTWQITVCDSCGYWHYHTLTYTR